MGDGTHFYVDAGVRRDRRHAHPLVAILRLMWGLHIMDLQTREDTHNPWMVGFAIASLVMIFLALALLPMTRSSGAASVRAIRAMPREAE